MTSEGVRGGLDLLRVDHTGGFGKPDRLRDVYVRFARGSIAAASSRRALAKL